ncbi:hypothetical protein [Mycobacterium sp. M26]|uniref:hypothetical protein n=1 Tax=Mycobacterium sp. M26 TaxID=1762962 RepID=UPI00073F480D|nr:hypothetical protein [Mycobacterium sp. M26]
MKLVVDSGLWSTGPAPAPVPLAAVIEVDGAVLSWTVDAPPGAAAQITLTDPARADWLWRIVGESGHRLLAEATGSAPPDDAAAVELPGLDVLPGSLAPLHRLALGHWLRRFWPESIQEAIAGLDPALLDAELAVATVEAEDFFGDGTLDSDVAELLAPHAAAVELLVASGDPRIVELAGRCVDLVEEMGLDAPGWSAVAEAIEDLAVSSGVPGRQDDYALAAGRGVGIDPVEVIARGVASTTFSGVPAAVFDAADDTVGWAIAVQDGQATAVLSTLTLGRQSPEGIPVALRCKGIRAEGALDSQGRATLPLVDEAGGPVTPSLAWDTDWSATTVIVGVEVDEPAEVRARIRRFARDRLASPRPDAFLAEILAAESDY